MYIDPDHSHGATLFGLPVGNPSVVCFHFDEGKIIQTSPINDSAYNILYVHVYCYHCVQKYFYFRRDMLETIGKTFYRLELY